MADEVTLGELERRLTRLEESVDKRFEVQEERNRWFSRSLVTSFAYPILVAMIVFMLLRGK